MSGSVLVVGGTGVVGRRVVEELGNQGVEVRVATRSPASVNRTAKATPVRLELAEPGTYEPALDGVSGLFVMSPPGHVDQDALVGPLVDAAARRGVRKIVAMTALGVEFDESLPLRKLERRIERAGPRYTVLRPTWFMQNFQTFWYGGIKAEGVIRLPAADSRTALVDARDIADGVVQALTSDRTDGKSYGLTGPQSLTYAEAAAALSQASGRTLRYEPISDEQFHAFLVQVAGLPKPYADGLTGMFGMVRAGSAAEVRPDTRELLGRPARTIEDYARDHAALFAA